MSTQTKCTISLCCLFIIEIFPLPFTAFISLYVIRRRPKWFPGVVERLYSNSPFDAVENVAIEHDAMKTRRNCTITLTILTILDLALPVTIPVALYIVRKRPRWFKNVADRLYADESFAQDIAVEFPAELTESLGKLDKRPEIAASQLKKHLALQRKNLSYAHFTAERKSLHNKKLSVQHKTN